MLLVSLDDSSHQKEEIISSLVYGQLVKIRLFLHKMNLGPALYAPFGQPVKTINSNEVMTVL